MHFFDEFERSWDIGGNWNLWMQESNCVIDVNLIIQSFFFNCIYLHNHMLYIIIAHFPSTVTH